MTFALPYTLEAILNPARCEIRQWLYIERAFILIITTLPFLDCFSETHFLHLSCQSRVQRRLFLASVMKMEVIIALIALFGSCVAVSR